MATSSSLVVKNGLIVTGSAGTSVAVVDSTGLAVTGTLTATGRSGVTMPGQTSALEFGQVSSDPTYGLLSFNGAFAATTLTGIWGGAGSPDMVIGVPTGGSIYTRVNNSTVTLLNSTGLAVTGTLTATGRSGVTMSGQTSAVNFGQVSSDPTYGLLSFNGAFAATTLTGIWGGAGTPDMIINVPTGGTIVSRVNNSTVTSLSSTGLAVTGTLTATGITTLSAATTPLLLSGAGSSSTTLASNYAIRINASVTAANYGGIFFDGSTAYDSFFGRVPTALSGINDGVGYVTYSGGAPTLRTLFSSTGLAVTGLLSSAQNSAGLAAQFVNADTADGYGVSIAAGGTSATRYSLVVRNPAATQDWFKISSETGQVGNSIFAPGPYPSPVVATISSTGLAVTGTLSATGVISATAAIRANLEGANPYAVFQADSSGAAGGKIWTLASNATGSPIGTAGGLSVRSSTDSTTVANFTSTGLAVTGTLTATGSGTLTNLLFSGGTLPGVGTPSIALRSSDNVIYHQSGSANQITFLDSAQNSLASLTPTSLTFNISNVNKLTLNSTGLAVTGTLESTLAATVNSANSTAVALVVKGETGNGIRQRFIGQASSGQYNWQIGTSITNAGQFEIIPSTVVDGTTFSTAVGRFTTTGLAVTGTLSSTLDATIQGLTVGRGAGAVASNTVVGAGALVANTTGIRNTAIGSTALSSVTVGNGNVAVGFQAGNVILGADDNVAIGNFTLNATTSGSFNTAVGSAALAANTTASYNTAVGYQAGYSNTTGTDLTAIGYQAGRANTGDYNVFVGTISGYSNTSGSGVVAVGRAALYANTTGGNNSAVGQSALSSNTTGSYNTAFGQTALNSNTTASYNTAVGYQSLYTNTTGGNNLALGVNALYSNTTASNNTAVGYGSGNAITTGAKNTILGAYSGNQSGLDIRTASNYIVLSDGDGNPRAYWNGANATFGGNLAVTGTLSATESGTGGGLGGITAATATAGGNAGYLFNTGGSNRWSLSLVGSAGVESLRFYDVNNSSTRMTLDSSGNLGIGTDGESMRLAMTGTIAASTYPLIKGTVKAPYSGGWGSLAPETTIGGYQLFTFRTDNGEVNKSSAIEVYLVSNTFGAGQTAMRFITGGYNSINGTEAMRITEVGNVGIGTSSPTVKLDVLGSARIATSTGSGGLEIGTASGQAQYQYINFGGSIGGTDYAWQIGRSPSGGVGPADGFYFYDIKANATRLSIDTNGNLGLGVTPSAWSSASRPALQLTNGAALFSRTGSTFLGQNFFYNASDAGTYIANGFAAVYIQASGQHQWYNAPSGTAGNAAALTQAMMLDASGNLGIGTSSPGEKLEVYVSRTASTNAVALLLNDNVTGVQTNGVYKSIRSASNSGSSVSEIRFVETDGTNNNTAIAFATAPTAGGLTERMRVGPDGKVGIGTASPTYTLDVVGTIAATQNSAGLAGNFVNSDATNGYGVSIAAGGTSATRYSLVVRNAAGTQDWFKVSSVTGEVGNSIFAPGAPGSSEIARFTTTGLGIGTSSPAFRLETVAGDSSSGQMALANFRTGSSVASYNAGLQIYATGSATAASRSVVAIWDADGADASSVDYFYINKLGNSGQVDLVQQSAAAMTFQTSGTERMRLDSSGNLLVGATSASAPASGFVLLPNYSETDAAGIYIAHKSGSSSGDVYAAFAYASAAIGSITQSGTTAVLYNTTSDLRLKENIQNSAPASALIDNLQVRQYDWKSDGSHQRYGFVAQEIVTVVPEAVYQPINPEEMMAVDYSKLVPMLVKEIQDLRKRLAAAGIA